MNEHLRHQILLFQKPTVPTHQQRDSRHSPEEDLHDNLSKNAALKASQLAMCFDPFETQHDMAYPEWNMEAQNVCMILRQRIRLLSIAQTTITRRVAAYDRSTSVMPGISPMAICDEAKASKCNEMHTGKHLCMPL
ncbi:hypothetical protein KIN20_001448 [Parelaphostrongylus tenuis]|uniref:Uncharacterized protein n=1 Tax=Parelaphostrongylus tenuis TaxID=148309 RepID=A0AAD5QEJ1_PARTN|nr:hypothetical protein KIN20_001448 [Parelaphostrongylus tenuis]